jgi:transketolase
MFNILEPSGLESFKKAEPGRFKSTEDGALYFNIHGLELEPVAGLDLNKLEKLAKILRGFSFAAINNIKSGHPGGSSSKTEQAVALLASGVFAFNPEMPEHPGRDRIVWSAGHCTPLAHSMNALVYEALELTGKSVGKDIDAARTKDLSKFRHISGPPGHVESCCAFADASTGPSGHGFSVALGMSTLHKSCGLPTKVFVFAGDAETEEGMSYEARNLAVTLGADNLIVMVDWNGFGIDGPITEVISTPFLNHWLGLGWNVIEADGHNLTELTYAYHMAANGFGNKKPTAIIAKTIKGKFYGKLENTADSHGTPAPQDEYVKIMNNLGFKIPGVEGDTAADINVVMSELTKDDAEYFLSKIKSVTLEAELVSVMEKALVGRQLVDYRSIKRPEVLPPELVFPEGEKIATRKATEAWYKWLMEKSAFFYVGSGDLAKSILTGAAEKVYGLINKENPLGRGIRYGIAEQNMGMMSAAMTQDILPGGFKAMSISSTYAVFTSMMTNVVRLALINNYTYPTAKGFFILMAAHDGPETGEDGPTHQGLFWMSMFDAYPGIKVYKPMDANETIEMLFYAMEKGEPIAISIMRPGTPVFKRGNGVPPAREAVNGAYVFKQYSGNGKPKKVLAISGGQALANAIEVMPDIEKEFDVKVVAVTSPELFEELLKTDPAKAKNIFSDEERAYTIAIHNGWPGFLYRFLMPGDYLKRSIGIDHYLKSGTPAEVYTYAGFDPKGLKEKILNAAK